MSERRIEGFSATDEAHWQAQERTLRTLRDCVAPATGGERVQVDDAAIFDALAQLPLPALPADFAAAVTAASEELGERRRQVRRFRRAVFGGLALAYALAAGAGLAMLDGAALKTAALAFEHGLNDAPWLAAALVAAVLVAALSRRGDGRGAVSTPGRLSS